MMSISGPGCGYCVAGAKVVAVLQSTVVMRQLLGPRIMFGGQNDACAFRNRRAQIDASERHATKESRLRGTPCVMWRRLSHLRFTVRSDRALAVCVGLEISRHKTEGIEFFNGHQSSRPGSPHGYPVGTRCNHATPKIVELDCAGRP
jgi:hypothetical protein